MANIIVLLSFMMLLGLPVKVLLSNDLMLVSSTGYMALPLFKWSMDYLPGTPS